MESKKDFIALLTCYKTYLLVYFLSNKTDNCLFVVGEKSERIKNAFRVDEDDRFCTFEVYDNVDSL